SVIYQEFNLIPYLSIAENIFLGRELLSYNSLIRDGEIRTKTREILGELNLSLDPDTRVTDLGVAMQQMIEVAKALSIESEILIMDEPTAALGEHEIEQLFKTIKNIKKRGISIIYISHRLKELWEIADRATILRDGEYISTAKIEDIERNYLIQKMVGRELSEQFPEREKNTGKEVLRVENLTGEGLTDISFNLHEGEVLGFAGLIGSGRTELMRCIFGVDSFDTGEIFIDNQKVSINKPDDAIKNGIGFITEDRKGQGLILVRSVRENITITDLDSVIEGLFIINDKEERVTDDLVEQLRIKTPDIEQEVRYLSGGNQQKVVLAKWLVKNVKVLIFDEPTRGIDVGAKREVYNLINRLSGQGVGIIMISSELPEILGMSDRILVMNNGSIAGELSIEDATQEKILEYATKELV
ncbi:MAG TPA: sugar ABC transporter ATP-binding protein, partial [Halanaerobiales bacterium]|nr:sugar ABC transporter ATP-binding protein [Halanaerobiales bacterium]